MSRGNVDIHNQFCAYGHWDYRTRRKQMRVPLHMISMLHLPILEIGLALFDSYVVVNAFIAWRNHILSGRPEKERSWRKYGIRAARLSLITRWAKRCSRHYPPTQPHKNKRQKLVNSLTKRNMHVYCMWARMPSCQTWDKAPRQSSSESSRIETQLCGLWENNYTYLLGMHDRATGLLSGLSASPSRLQRKASWLEK